MFQVALVSLSRRLGLNVCSCLTLLAFAAGANAQFGAAVNVSNTTGQYSVQPSMDFDAGGKIHSVWRDFQSAHILWYANNVSGSWVTSQIPTPGSGQFLTNQRIVITSDAIMHVFYGRNSQVWETTKPVTGGSWSAPVRLDVQAAADTFMLWATKTASNGIYMVYLHLYDANAGVWGRYKPLGGAWGAAELVRQGSTDDTNWPQTGWVVAQGDEVYAAYQMKGTQTGYFRKRNTNGTWNAEVALNTPAFAPRVAFSPTNGEMAATWHQDLGGCGAGCLNFNIMGKFSSNGGSSFGSTVNISQSAWLSRNASTTYDSAGNFHVFFERKSADGQQFDMWYRSRTAAGVWGSHVNVTNSPSDRDGAVYDALVARGTEIHILYGATKTGDFFEDVFYRTTGAPPPPVWSASFVSLSAPSSMVAGSTATVTVTFNNSGNQTWDTTNTKVGTSNPRERSSAFYNSADWQSAARPTVVNATTAPGSNGAFTFIAKAPTSTGSYSEQFELLQEGVTWFGGTGDDFTWNVTVTAATGTITGNVKDACNANLSGATVSTNVGGYTTTTDASGNYTLSNVVNGTYTVTASKSGYTSQTSGNLTVSSNTVSQNFTLPFASAGTISGTITDECGAAVSGAAVNTTTGCWSTTTAANGTYTLSNVAAGTYTVQASKSGFNTASTSNVSVTGGGTTTVNMTLVASAKGTISGTVTASGGGTISGATVSTTTGCWSTTTNASGQYTLSNVAAGTYTVTASKSGYNTGSQSGVVVNNGATTTVNFTLTSTATERVVFGNMEGGFWDTGWGGGSKIPNGWQGWFNPGDFNSFDEVTIKHGGAHSAKTTISTGGNSAGGGFKRGIIQNITMTPNASFTFITWARHTNGNCPSIMAWNPDGDTDPEHAYAAGRYQWVTTDNWGQLNIWVTRSMTGTATSTGNVTIIVGGAHHGGGGQGVVYVDDVSVVAP